jgi:pimeloyl-ACP methyl ester carboxylesterase
VLQTILIIGAVLMAIAFAGRAFQWWATARDAKRYPAPGRLVDIGTHRLHLREMGQGTPTVVFESGLMSTVLTWQSLQPEIAKITRTVSYDRAGLGWSDPGPMPRDAQRIVEELRELLKRSEIPPPYVLVGHSFAGLTTRLFAAEFPDEVAGLVLIDPVVPGEWNPASDHNRDRIRTGAKILRRAASLARWGALRAVAVLLLSGVKRIADPIVRLMSRGAPKGDGDTKSPLFWNLPPAERSMAPVFWVLPKFSETIASQLQHLPESSKQLAQYPAIAEIPVTVISAGNTPPARQLEQIAVANACAQGQHVIAAHCGHWITEDDPKLVRNAIEDVLNRARSSATPQTTEYKNTHAGNRRMAANG